MVKNLQKEIYLIILNVIKKLAAKLIRVPKFDEVPYPVQMEPNLVVEFYSRN